MYPVDDDERPYNKRFPISHVRQHPLSIARGTKRIEAFLNQDKYWVNAQNERVRIKDMDLDYLFSTMVHLIKRAPELYLYIELNRNELPLGFLGDSPEAIRTTPLFLRMKERYQKLMETA
jgi:hypothetical protein